MAKEKNPDLLVFHFSDHGGGAGGDGVSNPDSHDKDYSTRNYMCVGKNNGNYEKYYYSHLFEKLMGFKRVFIMLCCCHPMRRFVLPDDANEADAPQVLMWTASNNYSFALMDPGKGQKMMTLIKGIYKNGMTYDDAWKTAQTNPKINGSKYYRYAYTETSGKGLQKTTTTITVTTGKTTYNGFDESALMFY